MPLSDIVNVQIGVDYLAVTQAGFGTLMIVGDSEAQGARSATYSTLAAMVAVGFATTDSEYLMAQKLLSQNPTVTQFKVGEKRSGDLTWPDALAAIALEDDDWYGLSCDTHTKADQILIAAWVESHSTRKVYFTSSQEAAIVDTTQVADDASLAYELQSASYARTCLLYHSSADSNYLEAGYAGVILRETPGSYTGMFKNIIGVTADRLTDTQAANALAKNCNTFEVMGGVNIVREGRTSGGAAGGGAYLDMIIGIDWTHARVTESVFGFIVSQKKVPFTDAGITGVQSKVEAPLKRGVDNGLYSPMEFDSNGVQIGGYIVNVPLAANVSIADKVARRLTGTTFTAWGSGAIHGVVVNGIVTI